MSTYLLLVNVISSIAFCPTEDGRGGHNNKLRVGITLQEGRPVGTDEEWSVDYGGLVARIHCYQRVAPGRRSMDKVVEPESIEPKVGVAEIGDAEWHGEGTREPGDTLV